MKTHLNCVTKPEVLDLLPLADGAACKRFISEPAISILARKIQKEIEENNLPIEDVIYMLAESSLLSFALFELAKTKVEWPKDVTA
jgi:hypothetical protein